MINVVVVDEGDYNVAVSRNVLEADIVVRKKVTYEVVKNRRGPTGELKSLEDLTAYL